VEESFRMTKTDFKVRPIFHWTERRVRAHFAICFLTLMLSRHLQYRMNLVGEKHSVAELQRCLLKSQYCILRHPKSQQRYAVPMRMSKTAQRMYKLMGISRSNRPMRLGD